MERGVITVGPLRPGSPELEVCARWRVGAFSVLGGSVEAERRSLAAFLATDTDRASLFATYDGALAGTCLLVPSEIAALHEVSPWLAGLYVTPEHRRAGVGAALVRAVEDAARVRGHTRLHLYATDSVGYYQQLGWRAADRVSWEGHDTTLMVRDLRGVTIKNSTT